tara:strand:+ start:4563 stop:4787 length:225 start_codon:yes stop_codon:yes gene_type:complete
MATKEKALCIVAEGVREKLKLRAEVGLEKYGVTMMREDLDLLAWARLAQEEAMDLAVYLERIIIKIEENKNEPE